ncbi:MAG: SH3 domain-containing protein [Pseudomonas sp.]
MEVVTTDIHISDYPNPFYLRQGDKVALGEMDDEFPNWILITNAMGEQGWAPIQYIEKIEGISEGVILQDYDNVELNTVIGEKLSVLFELNSWYRVLRSTGEIGWVPVRSVQRLPLLDRLASPAARRTGRPARVG